MFIFDQDYIAVLIPLHVRLLDRETAQKLTVVLHFYIALFHPPVILSSVQNTIRLSIFTTILNFVNPVK